MRAVATAGAGSPRLPAVAEAALAGSEAGREPGLVRVLAGLALAPVRSGVSVGLAHSRWGPEGPAVAAAGVARSAL